MKFLPVFLLVLVVSSCLSDPDCVTGTYNNVQFRMKLGSTNGVKKVKFSSIEISGRNTAFPVFTDSVSSFSLPLDPFATETTYKWTYRCIEKTQVIDGSGEFTISYSGQNVIVSESCSPYVIYSNLDVPSYSYTEKPLVLNRQLSVLSQQQLLLNSAPVNIEIKF